MDVIKSSGRLLSLDVMRGIIMILLAAESCWVYKSLSRFHLGTLGDNLVQQFFHHPWHGLRFWDLVQPAFMTMAGVALYISYYQKKQRGISWQRNFKHVAIRCVQLFLFGTGIHCVVAGKLVWELWNVLTQLSVTTLIAYCIIRTSYSFQLIFSIILLLLTEILYRFVSIPGYDQPFVIHHNFGTWMDIILMGKINPDGWVAINFIPTAAHTIWGALAGKLLIISSPAGKKIKQLVLAGAIGLLIGFGLDIMNITPIIKRISTSSFVLVSGGFVMWMLAALYWITDVKKVSKYAWIFVIVGMNSLFIYLFFETVGHLWFNNFVGIFVKGFIGMMGVPENILAVIAAFVTLFAEWYLCYWLYKRKIFFKL
jgi:predicted acyltransferase